MKVSGSPDLLVDGILISPIDQLPDDEPTNATTQERLAERARDLKDVHLTTIEADDISSLTLPVT